jgi:hypothetical protein
MIVSHVHRDIRRPTSIREVEFVYDAQNPVNGRPNLMEIAAGPQNNLNSEPCTYCQLCCNLSLDSLGRSRVPNLHNVIHMIAESNK